MILSKDQIQERIDAAMRRIKAAQHQPERVKRLALHMGAHLIRLHLAERDPTYEYRRAERGR